MNGSETHRISYRPKYADHANVSFRVSPEFPSFRFDGVKYTAEDIAEIADKVLDLKAESYIVFTYVIGHL